MNNIHEREPFLPDDFARLEGEKKAAAQKFNKAVKQSILEYVRSGKGVVGIENTHVVRPEGLEQLGRFQEEIVVI